MTRHPHDWRGWARCDECGAEPDHTCVDLDERPAPMCEGRQRKARVRRRSGRTAPCAACGAPRPAVANRDVWCPDKSCQDVRAKRDHRRWSDKVGRGVQVTFDPGVCARCGHDLVVPRMHDRRYCDDRCARGAKRGVTSCCFWCGVARAPTATLRPTCGDPACVKARKREWAREDYARKTVIARTT
jgi:hypothetical protein